MPLSNSNGNYWSVIDFLKAARLANGDEIFTNVDEIQGILQDTNRINLQLDNGELIFIDTIDDESFSVTYPEYYNEDTGETFMAERHIGPAATEILNRLTSEDEERRTVLQSIYMFQNPEVLLFEKDSRQRLSFEEVHTLYSEQLELEEELDTLRGPTIQLTLQRQELLARQQEGNDLTLELENNERALQALGQRALQYQNRINDIQATIAEYRQEEMGQEESETYEVTPEVQAFVNLMMEKGDVINHLREQALRSEDAEDQMAVSDLIARKENEIRLASLMHPQNPDYMLLNDLISRGLEFVDPDDEIYIRDLMEKRNEMAENLNYDNFDDFTNTLFLLYNQDVFINLLNLAQEQIIDQSQSVEAGEEFDIDQMVENMQVAYLAHQPIRRRVGLSSSSSMSSLDSAEDFQERRRNFQDMAEEEADEYPRRRRHRQVEYEEDEEEVASVESEFNDVSLSSQEGQEEDLDMDAKLLPIASVAQAAVAVRDRAAASTSASAAATPASASAAAVNGARAGMASASASASASAEKPVKRSLLDRLFGRNKPADEHKDKDKKGKKVAPAQTPAPASTVWEDSPAASAANGGKPAPARAAWTANAEEEEVAVRRVHTAPIPAADGRPSPIVRGARLVRGGQDTQNGQNSDPAHPAHR